MIRDLEEVRLERISKARKASYDAAIHDRLHRYKNRFQNLIATLEKIKSGQLGSRRQILEIDRQIQSLRREIEDLNNEFEETSYVIVNINHIVQNVAKEISEQIVTPSVDYITDFDTGVPAIEVDERDFEEIIFNLIINGVRAIKASGARPGELRLRTSMLTVDAIGYLQVEIEDNGVGIPRENADSVYKKNFTTYEEGSGLGLYITQQIVTRYGGKIFFNSVVGKGTKFFVRIPFRRFLP